MTRIRFAAARFVLTPRTAPIAEPKIPAADKYGDGSSSGNAEDGSRGAAVGSCNTAGAGAAAAATEDHDATPRDPGHCAVNLGTGGVDDDAARRPIAAVERWAADGTDGTAEETAGTRAAAAARRSERAGEAATSRPNEEDSIICMYVRMYMY
mmetsp:Transcript_18597/g.53620  ORF Transcript_18597/g.53620 Transcript_18597/m.53620 type:complete len:153 (+) Transcript_18597:792-1250(+)